MTTGSVNLLHRSFSTRKHCLSIYIYSYKWREQILKNLAPKEFALLARAKTNILQTKELNYTSQIFKMKNH